MIDQPKSDAEWRAEQDADTIAEAKIILADKERLKRAQAAAERKAKELHERANKMDSVAGSKTLGMGQQESSAKQRPLSKTGPTELSVSMPTIGK